MCDEKNKFAKILWLLAQKINSFLMTLILGLTVDRRNVFEIFILCLSQVCTLLGQVAFDVFKLLRQWLHACCFTMPLEIILSDLIELRWYTISALTALAFIQCKMSRVMCYCFHLYIVDGQVKINACYWCDRDTCNFYCMLVWSSRSCVSLKSVIYSSN